MWVDTNVHQLYLFHRTVGWVLIGPNTVVGLKTEQPETVVGTDDLSYSIVKLEVEAQTVKIIQNSLTFKITIPFSSIKSGSKFKTNKFSVRCKQIYGTSEKAESLVVGNTTVVPGNFLRSDTIINRFFLIKLKLMMD